MKDQTVDQDELDEQPDYLSYLMRLWRVRSEGRSTWRASLESALSGERQNFSGLDDLWDFLRRQTGHTSPTDEMRTKGEKDAHQQQDEASGPGGGAGLVGDQQFGDGAIRSREER